MAFFKNIDSNQGGQQETPLDDVDDMDADIDDPTPNLVMNHANNEKIAGHINIDLNIIE
jgi:hypothetical protein